MPRNRSGSFAFHRRLIARTLVALLCATTAPAFGQNVSTGDLPQLRRHALELVNRARAAEGLAPLALGSGANAAAQAHAEDMLTRGYYSHTSPSGATVRDRYQKAGGGASRLAAENMARCTGCAPPPISASVDALQEGWMQSPSHRTNILRQGLREFGFGIAADGKGGLYAVQVFAGPGIPRDLQPGEPTTALSAEAQLGAALGQVNRARRAANIAPLEASEILAAAARTLLPDPAAEGFSFGDGQRLYAALPEVERPRWRSLAVLGAACGGCGEAPTEADIRDFTEQWLMDQRHRATLLDAAITHLGFAMATDGEGRKVVVAVLGNRP